MNWKQIVGASARRMIVELGNCLTDELRGVRSSKFEVPYWYIRSSRFEVAGELGSYEVWEFLSQKDRNMQKVVCAETNHGGDFGQSPLRGSRLSYVPFPPAPCSHRRSWIVTILRIYCKSIARLRGKKDLICWVLKELHCSWPLASARGCGTMALQSPERMIFIEIKAVLSEKFRKTNDEVILTQVFSNQKVACGTQTMGGDHNDVFKRVWFSSRSFGICL